MNALRVTLTVFLVGVWLLAAPLAMASDHCLAMSAMCEGPCGLMSGIVASTIVMATPEPLAAAGPAVTSSLPRAIFAALEPPPKSASRSA